MRVFASLLLAAGAPLSEAWFRSATSSEHVVQVARSDLPKSVDNSDVIVQEEIRKLRGNRAPERRVQGGCEDKDFDVCFAIDMSGSICSPASGSVSCDDCPGTCNSGGLGTNECCPNFKSFVDFARDSVVAADALPMAQRFSLVTFSEVTHDIIQLETEANIITYFNAIDYTGGDTNHEAAILACQSTLISSNREKFIVLLTDGYPTSPTPGALSLARTAAETALNNGIKTVPVYVRSDAINNDAAISFLKELSFDGTALSVSDFTSLDDIGEHLLSKISCYTISPTAAPTKYLFIPEPGDDSATTPEDTAVLIDILTNDSDPNGDPLTITTVGQGGHGATIFNSNKTVTYTPEPNFFGVDTFTYEVADGNGNSKTATVTVTVTSVNDPPVAVDDTETTAEDTPVTVIVLANDQDIENGLLVIDATTNPSNGTIKINTESQTITYTPNQDFNGVDTFTYTINDGYGVTSTASVTITVTAVNDAPVAAADTETTPEDTPVTLNILQNDSDVDGDTLTLTSVGDPGNGVVVTNSDQTITYNPNTNFHGVDTFSYSISDGNGETSDTTVTITVTSENDAPVAVDDSATISEDTQVTLNVLSNDGDADGDTLKVISVSLPNNGTAEINEDNTITYIPNNHFNGVDSFTYTIDDENGGTSTATVTITVTSVNDSPEATDTSATTQEDTPVNVPVLGNDIDVDGDTMTVESTSVPANGVVVINNDNTVTYTPNTDFHGIDTFDYTISDGKGGTSTATVTITVTPINDNPVASDASATTPEDTPVVVAVLSNDSDVDGDSLTIESTTEPSNGTVVVNLDGSVKYSPDADFHGVDTFDYTISDGKGGTSTATVTITVTSINDDPVAVDDAYTTPEDTAATIAVLSNDSDVDGDVLTVVSTSDPSNGAVTLNSDNTVTYAPDANFHGVDSFDYTISDGVGGSSSATVTVTVTSVNDGPNLQDDSASTPEDEVITIPILANDSDVEGDDLTITSCTSPSNGTVTVNEDNTITYTPDANFAGVDTFSCEVCDVGPPVICADETVTVTIGGVNDAPVALDDSMTTPEDTPVTITVLSNDSDIEGDNLTVTTVTSPSNGIAVINAGKTVTYSPNPNFNGVDSFDYSTYDGNGGSSTATVTITVTSVNDNPVASDASATTQEDTPVVIPVLANGSDVDGDTMTVVSVSDPANGVVVINADGTVTYTPNTDFHGVDTFDYTISDGNGGTSIATVTITVTPINDNPVAVDDVYTTPEDTPVVVAVLSNDSDVDGDTLTVVSTTEPSNGSVVINANGSLTYTPNPDFNGIDSFDYTISDGVGGASTATVTITVSSTKDLPVALDDSASTQEDVAITISVLSNDSDVDGDPLTVESLTSPNGGTATINSDNTILYTPSPNFNGIDSFEYSITDGNGGSASATVTVTVYPLQDPPTAVDDSSSTPEDIPVTITVLGNDFDVDGDNLTVVSVTSPGHGSALINADQTVTYNPELNFHGTDSFQYTISDGNGGTSTATVTITVTSVNDDPVAVDDSVSTLQGSPVIIFALDNDIIVDVSDTLTLLSVDTPNDGTISMNSDNSVTYSPNPEFYGVDKFLYAITDGNGGTSSANIIVSVNPYPIVVNDFITTSNDVDTIIEVLENDSHPYGYALTVSSCTNPPNGNVVINPDYSVTYSALSGYIGLDVFECTVCEYGSASSCDVGKVFVDVVYRKWYPQLNWGNQINTVCLYDGKEPDYMTSNPEAWLFTTKEECCARYFPWKQDVCLGEIQGTSIGYLQSTALFYPGWDTGKQYCINNGLQPPYMVRVPSVWLFESYEDCCNQHFNWDKDNCYAQSGSLVMYWYPVLDGSETCQEDSEGKESQYSVGGNIVNSYRSLSSCCSGAFGDSELECIEKSAGIELPKSIETGLGGDWYPAVDYGDSSLCLNDGNQADYMREAPQVWTFPTQSECCAQFYPETINSCLSATQTRKLSGQKRSLLRTHVV